MAVRTKGRRRITVDNKLYVWCVALDFDSSYYVCNIVSEDKSVVISCPLETEIPYAIFKGSQPHWKRFALPFDVPDIITPSFVSRVILWAEQDCAKSELEWNGTNVPI